MPSALHCILMKHLLVVFGALFLTGCLGGDSGQVLPPELNNPLNTDLPPVSGDPLAGFPPIETPLTTPSTQTTTPEGTPKSTENQNAATAANCEALIVDLENSFTDMNFCNTDAECAVAEGSCPFGCYLFHNTKLDFSDYQESLDTYRESCDPCEYKCATKPRQNDRRCKEGRCVDTRYDS